MRYSMMGSLLFCVSPPALEYEYMLRAVIGITLGVGLLVIGNAQPCMAQVETVPHTDEPPAQNQVPPRYESDKTTAESSSRDTKIDLSPPKDDAKDHPFSDTSEAGETEPGTGTQEFHPWDPHKAAKDVEVGDFYYRRKNYRAALSRYQDALLWKENDADAIFRSAQCFEKLDKPVDAAAQYQQYLKILPHGPDAKEAEKSVERLKPNSGKEAASNQGKAPSEGPAK